MRLCDLEEVALPLWVFIFSPSILGDNIYDMPRKRPPSVAMVIKQRLHMHQLGLLHSKAGPSPVTQAALGPPAQESVKIMAFTECQLPAGWVLRSPHHCLPAAPRKPGATAVSIPRGRNRVPAGPPHFLWTLWDPTQETLGETEPTTPAALRGLQTQTGKAP